MFAQRFFASRPTVESSFADANDGRRDILRLLEAVAGIRPSEAGAGVFPPLNVSQDDDHLYVRAEVPGLAPNDLSVSAFRNRLSISGKRDIAREHEGVSYHRRERAEGSFSRTLTLPAEVDAARIDARYADGILTLTLPKADEAKPRQIKVRT